MKKVRSLGLWLGLLGGVSLLGVGCGGGDSSYASGDDGSTDTTQGDDGGHPPPTESGPGNEASGDDSTDVRSADDGGNPGDGPALDSQGTCGTCPAGYTCGTANGLSVCRAASGVPLFTNVFVVLMENTSLSTLQTAIGNGSAPNLKAFASKYATGSDYHGVGHPSLPNYIALTSGDTQGIPCDCLPTADGGVCLPVVCLVVPCSCPTAAMNLADQIEGARKSWKNFAENMGAACNLVGSGSYAPKHVPFLYYTDQQSQCASNVVDFTQFDPKSPASFTFISPNLVHDMHDPSPPNGTNVPNGDAWVGPHVQNILDSDAYARGGLVVVVWDEDDGSGIPVADAPVPIFVMSPFAKSGGYVSPVHADHYSLLATFEDGLGLTRLGKAAAATPLADYFPAN